MKKFGVFAAALLVATPAMAWVKVTNLSGAPQSVTLSSAGSATTRIIADQQTEMFIATEGMLSLNDPETIRKAQTAKPGPLGELLGDVVAANRASDIPAKPGSSFVIWPDGRLMVQRHRHTGGYSW